MTIAELLDRGQKRFRASLSLRYGEDMPIGIEGTHVVTRDDFVHFTELCLEYVINVRTLHMLDDDGMIVILMCRSRRE